MRTYLQEKLTGLEGQLVTFDREGRAVAGDLPDGLLPRLNVTVVRGRVTGPITVTASCGGHRIARRAEPGQNRVVLLLRGYGLWQVDAEAEGGGMIGTHREVNVDTVKEYQTEVGVERRLGLNPPALIREALELGVGERIWKVGDEIDLTLTDGRPLTMQLYDFRHDRMPDGAYAPATFGTKHCLERRAQNSTQADNRSGWGKSELRAYLNQYLEGLLPAEWRAVIRTVQKSTAKGGRNSALAWSEDKLFLIAGEEAFGGTVGSALGEGGLYPIFTDNNSRKKQDELGRPTGWWLRSPVRDDAERYCCVNGMGDNCVANADTVQGLAFCFCV